MVIHTDLAGYQATVAAAKMHADTKAKGLTIGLAGGNFFPTPAAIILPNDASVSDINGIAATVSYEWQSGEGLSFENPAVIGSGDRYPIAAVDFCSQRHGAVGGGGGGCFWRKDDSDFRAVF